MLIEEALYSLLSANSAVTMIVSDRIYPVTMPSLEKGGTFYPAVVFDLAGRERHQTHQGPDGLVKSRLMIRCLGPKYFEVKTLADKVRLALNGKSAELAALYQGHVKGIFLEDESDEYVYDEVEQLSLYHVPMDFLIQHKEQV